MLLDSPRAKIYVDQTERLAHLSLVLLELNIRGTFSLKIVSQDFPIRIYFEEIILSMQRGVM